MNVRSDFYDFMIGLLNMVWMARQIFGPFLVMAVILFVVRWGMRTARGERLDDLSEDANTLRSGWRSGGSIRSGYDANRHYRDQAPMARPWSQRRRRKL